MHIQYVQYVQRLADPGTNLITVKITYEENKGNKKKHKIEQKAILLTKIVVLKPFLIRNISDSKKKRE